MLPAKPISSSTRQPISSSTCLLVNFLYIIRRKKLQPCRCKFKERHDLDAVSVFVDFPLVIVRDDCEVVAFQLSCTFNQTGNFTLLAFGRCHIIADLDKLVDVSAISGHEIHFTVVVWFLVCNGKYC